MAAIPSNQYQLLSAKQSANGTPATLPTFAYRQVAGDVSLTPDYGQENFSNLTRFSESADYVNSLLGQGTPGIQAQPTEFGELCYLYFTNTTASPASQATGVYRHQWEADDTVASPNYSTWWKQVGTVTGEAVYHKFNDCRLGQLQIEGSTANKVIRATPSVLSLNPGAWFGGQSQTGWPTLSTEDPFIYTEGAGNFKFKGGDGTGIDDGTTLIAVRGQSQFTVTFNDNLTPVFGDDISPFELFPGQSEITAAISIVMDSAGLQEYNNLVYGVTSPNNLAVPTRTVPLPGAYSFYIDRYTPSTTAYRGLRVEIPGIRWSPDAAVAPNPDGGPIEFALSGGARRLTGTENYYAKITLDTNRTAQYSN